MNNKWELEAVCDGDDVELYFDKYEEDLDVRNDTDAVCLSCPVAKFCFAKAISDKSWGVRGGIYLENGKISKEFNNHKTKEQWAEIWQNLTMDK